MIDSREYWTEADIERGNRALIELIEKSRTPEPRKITPAAGIIEAPGDTVVCSKPTEAQIKTISDITMDDLIKIHEEVRLGLHDHFPGNSED